MPGASGSRARALAHTAYRCSESLREKFGTLHVSLCDLYACCGYSETGSWLVRVSATRRYASRRVKVTLKKSHFSCPAF